MTAFVIGLMNIHSRDWMDDCVSKIPDVMRRHMGRFVARAGAPELLHGERELPDAAVIIEFPGRDHAGRFRASDASRKPAMRRRSGPPLNSVPVDAPEPA